MLGEPRSRAQPTCSDSGFKQAGRPTTHIVGRPPARGSVPGSSSGAGCSALRVGLWPGLPAGSPMRVTGDEIAELS